MGAPQTKEKASGSATAYRALQQDVRIFLNIDLPNLVDNEARDQLGQIVQRLQQLNQAAEIPSPGAWHRARRSIEQGAQHYQADEHGDESSG